MKLIQRLCLFFCLAGLGAPALAQDELTSLPGNVLVMRGLDKVTARTEDFEIRIGEEHAFGSLTILPRYCRRRPPEETPETFVFVEIFERRLEDGSMVEEGGERIFSGWMMASNPALNPLEHPVYDVWPIDCRA
ncbi:DUF2155 domain-containing protein [Hyphobacterium sp.]|uniref:DUF2155 domain-containing protein n=1 Tax=Hyphobacterium sp. TaxID=2004662 RepID=UPI003BAA99E3